MVSIWIVICKRSQVEFIEIKRRIKFRSPLFRNLAKGIATTLFGGVGTRFTSW